MKRTSRRGWLSALLKPDEPKPAARPRPSIPIFRPPGALAETQFLEACERCGECIKACPHDVLKPAISRLRHVSGTPTFDPGSNPCLLCEGLPCATACPTEALDPNRAVRMGVAQINPTACTANVDGCPKCADECPIPWAIQVRPRRAPHIDPRACVGCGVCASVCPAPINAVILMPRRGEVT
jgi:ferredoxin-type protein NapG